MNFYGIYRVSEAALGKTGDGGGAGTGATRPAEPQGPQSHKARRHAALTPLEIRHVCGDSHSVAENGVAAPPATPPEYPFPTVIHPRARRAESVIPPLLSGKIGLLPFSSLPWPNITSSLPTPRVIPAPTSRRCASGSTASRPNRSWRASMTKRRCTPPASTPRRNSKPGSMPCAITWSSASA
ncbi:hypothetical protein CBM2605_P160010 [Cupriavidus neocaledonicus]|uniref:Uncharacterized protein n=1 Tax=Cupriavidus neocaledonicus TaxID=1040979 RepID=A0ABY1VDM6_9BURK|nr:hypothetical protein CBM2605_P160010 [Cupriavidus neocaledonicus]